MENALKQLSDDHSLSSCIALGHELPVLGTSSLSLRYFISLIFTFAALGDAEVAGFVCHFACHQYFSKTYSWIFMKF